MRLVNDIHSQLNATRVAREIVPATEADVQRAVRWARTTGTQICVAGGRHAMGGQQFAADAVLIDTRALKRVTAFDRERGHLTVEAGIQWPDLMQYLRDAQPDRARAWGIVQKQTGADRLSLGGAISCNAHGRGLTLGPIIQQVEGFDLVDADGRIRSCSRTRHRERFRLAIGGYGLFGVITRVTLRLAPRVKVQRVVQIRETFGIAEAFEQRIRDGYLFGDYQFDIDDRADTFLRRGVFSCYRPVAEATPITATPLGFSADDWRHLIYDAHWHKTRAFAAYSSRYLETSGQVYWADAQLSSAYVDDYHADLDRAAGARVKATEMITELYVPREALARFMEDARASLRARRANVVYGTVRMIEQDRESVLAWARERFACVVFNLHVEHTPDGIARTADAFRDLIDIAIAQGGSYYLTYHRWARRDQIDACYPQMRDFLAMKRRYDPHEILQSDWYRHYRRMFDEAPAAPHPRHVVHAG